MKRCWLLLALLLADACASPAAPTDVGETAKPPRKKGESVRKLTLGKEHAQHLVLSRGKGGELESSCVRGESAARALVEGRQSSEQE